jgi:hypothetical protein
MDTVEYTLWNIATREVYSTGVSVAERVVAPEGHRIHYGVRIDGETHIYGPDDLPIPRSAPKLVSPEEASALVNRERQRRIEIGVDFDGVWVTGSDKDILNLTNLALGAQLRVAMGDATLTVFRDGRNIDHELAPMQMLGLWQAASAHVSAIYAASWALKGMDPFPVDYQDDSYWP